MQSTSNDKEALPKAQLEANLHAEEVAIEEQAAQIRKEAQIKSKEHQSDDSDKSAKASSESKEVPTMPIVDKDDLAAKKQDSQTNNSQEPVQGSQTLENNRKFDSWQKKFCKALKSLFFLS